MARQVIWTRKANQERQDILRYWIEKNKSKTYSLKLNKLIIESLKIISEQPMIGRKTDEQNVRVKIIRDYLLFYEIYKSQIVVLTIWDSRRELTNLKTK